MNQDLLTATYIDIVTGHLHRTLNMLFTAEANYHVVEKELAAHKDVIVQLQGFNNDLTATVEMLKSRDSNSSEEVTKLQERLRVAEDQVTAQQGKLAHMDTFSSNIKAQAKELEEKNKKIEELEQIQKDLASKLGSAQGEIKSLENELKAFTEVKAPAIYWDPKKGLKGPASGEGHVDASLISNNEAEAGTKVKKKKK